MTKKETQSVVKLEPKHFTPKALRTPKSFWDWNELGYRIKRGEKATGHEVVRNRFGSKVRVATFTFSQVRKKPVQESVTIATTVEINNNWSNNSFRSW